MRRREVGRDRGQIVIIAALLIAVVFVSLALVLNSAIFAENLSARSTGSAGDVLQATSSSYEDIDIMVGEVNIHHNSSYDELTRNYSKMTSGYQETQGAEYANRGKSLQLTRVAQTNGTYLQQTAQTRNFTDASGDTSDWQVAGAVKGVSDYEMEVNRNDLYTDDGVLLSDLLANSFSIHITDENGAVWEAHIYENSNNNVTVKPILDGNEKTSCEVDSSRVRIDFVAGTVGGMPCPTLTFAEGLDGTLDIEYRDPDKIGGSYVLRVDTIIDPASSTHYAEPGTGYPSATPNIYATTIRVTYADSTTSFTSERRIVSGEPAYAG